MLSSCLLSGAIISSISLSIYALITHKNNDENDKINLDKKYDYMMIFSIVMVVSVLILYFTDKKDNQIIPLKDNEFVKKMNNAYFSY